MQELHLTRTCFTWCLLRVLHWRKQTTLFPYNFFFFLYLSITFPLSSPNLSPAWGAIKKKLSKRTGWVHNFTQVHKADFELARQGSTQHCCHCLCATKKGARRPQQQLSASDSILPQIKPWLHRVTAQESRLQ